MRQFTYSGVDSLPLKMTEITTDGYDTSHDTTYLSYNVSGQIIRENINSDTNIHRGQVIYSYGANSVLVDEQYGGYPHTITTFNFTIANGDRVSEQDPQQPYGYLNTYTFDSHRNPFLKVDLRYPTYNRSDLGVVVQPNNVIDEIYMGYGTQSEMKASYTYRNDGYPINVLIFYPSSPGLYLKKGIYSYQ